MEEKKPQEKENIQTKSRDEGKKSTPYKNVKSYNKEGKTGTKTSTKKSYSKGSKACAMSSGASGKGWTSDLKKAYEINEKINKDRLNPHYKLNLNTTAKIKLTPLGGLGEIGGNMMVIETDKSAIIVDVGMSFPDEDMHGVDILIPDFTYIREIKNKIAGIVITHGHEDHIGAVPYLFKELQFPIYGTSLPLEMIGSKFDEHKIIEHKKFFRAVKKRTPIKIGDFEVEWIHITHSIIDSSALAIKCEAGTIIHTGDFKIDHTPIDSFPTDLQRLAHYG
jgi:ribonuclease J